MNMVRNGSSGLILINTDLDHISVVQGGDWGFMVRPTDEFNLKGHRLTPNDKVARKLSLMYRRKNVKAWHTNFPVYAFEFFTAFYTILTYIKYVGLMDPQSSYGILCFTCSTWSPHMVPENRRDLPDLHGFKPRAWDTTMNNPLSPRQSATRWPILLLAY